MRDSQSCHRDFGVGDGDDAGGRAGQRARLDDDDSAGNGASNSFKHAWLDRADSGLDGGERHGRRLGRDGAGRTHAPGPDDHAADWSTRSSDTGGDDREDGGLDPSQSGGSHASIRDDDSSSSDDSSYRPGYNEGDHGSPSDDDRGSSSSDIDPRERSARSRRTAAARRRGRTCSRAPRRGSDKDNDGPDESRRSWKRSIKALELMPFKPSPTMFVSTWIAKVDLALRGARVAGRGSCSDE
ncbi:unnamed protein product [Phytophthora lilii]|uniref:Unnamed protein product n=1 Tax=Phytophthora lilii TaxID=2077276 RepID=A0A9W7CNR7_9STRA|nr:unnamed protein product [Phytophthora lilii]